MTPAVLMSSCCLMLFGTIMVHVAADMRLYRRDCWQAAMATGWAFIGMGAVILIKGVL